MDDIKYKECFEPAVAWMKKNAPDFVFECMLKGMSANDEVIDSYKKSLKLQQEYVLELENIREIQNSIIQMLEERIKEIEDQKF